jgi:hypothetical protein
VPWVHYPATDRRDQSLLSVAVRDTRILWIAPVPFAFDCLFRKIFSK